MEPERFDAAIYSEKHLIFGDGKILVGEFQCRSGSHVLTFTKSKESHEIGATIKVSPTDKLFFDTILEFKNIESAKLVHSVLERLIQDMEQ